MSTFGTKGTTFQYPKPAGAAALGLNTRAYNFRPQYSDVGFNGFTADATKKLYSGIYYNGSTPDSSHYVVNSSPLVLHLGGRDGNPWTNLCSQQMSSAAGVLGYFPGNAPFYAEWAMQMSNWASDSWPALWLLPKEHDNVGSDTLPIPPAPVGTTSFRGWMELDCLETFGSQTMTSSHVSWSGQSSALGQVNSPSQSGTTFTTASQAFTAGLCVYINGGTPGGFSQNTPYFVLASGLTSTSVQLAATPGGAAITATSSASCSLTPNFHSWTTNNSGSGPAFTPTNINRFGVGWDPVNHKATYYLNDTLSETLNTGALWPPDLYIANPYNFYLIMSTQSHNSAATQTPFDMMIHNIQAWTP